MVAGKNYNIITKVKQFGEGVQAAFGSSVAAGMTRYVTMVQVSQVKNSAAAGSRIIFGSAAAAGSFTTIASASGAAKFVVGIGSYVASHVGMKTVRVPSQPNTENPLFTVAASKFLVAKECSAAGQSATCHVFVQYYDQ